MMTCRIIVTSLFIFLCCAFVGCPVPLLLMGGLQVFTEPQVLFESQASTEGGPGGAGMTIVLYLYHQAFENYQFGYGSAISWALFLIIVLFSVLNWKLVHRPGIR